MKLDRAEHIRLRAVENPVMHEYAANIVGHRADQFVHPWWFGSPAQKATGFKLYKLPKLPKERTKESYGDLFYNKHNAKIVQKVFHMGKGVDAQGRDRAERRSETDPQVARAIAQYWGHLIY